MVKVAVGMSGGVDSSLTAWLLKSEGHEVIGITMEVYDGAPDGQCKRYACYGPSETDDVAAAREVARFLGIGHYALDLRREYRETVLDYFTSEYARGRTPNPCVRCNPKIKFGYMLQKARESGIAFERFATGHYARIEYCPEQRRYLLKRGRDPKKDQSYFLYGLNREQLSQLRMPLGGMTKAEVRARAQQIGLPVAQRPESQDFAEGGDYRALLGPEVFTPGPIQDASGKQLGEHRGIANYTIGQRRGLKIAYKEPLYVINIDAQNNAVIVGPKKLIFANALLARDLNFLTATPPPARIAAQIRHNQKAAPAELTLPEAGAARVVFDEPQAAVTPGQSVVFYDGETVIGGGVIERSII